MDKNRRRARITRALRSGARRNTVVAAASVAALLSAASAASGQFITAITKPTFGLNNPDVYNVNPTTGAATFLFNADFIPASAPGFGGLAADEPNRRLFGTVRNGAQDDLYSLDYSTLTPTLLGTIRRPGTTTGMAVDGLAYDSLRGSLYATRVLGGTSGAEALFRVDIATGDTSIFLEYEPTTTSNYTIGAIDYDPLTDRIYLVDEDDTGGRNIYSVNPAAATPVLDFVAALPAPITDVDGLAAGDGRLYLVSDGPDIAGTATIEGNGGNHYVYDIAAGTFSILGPTPYPEYNTSSLGRINPSAAGAFAPGIPEPTLLAPTAAVALAAFGRRRRRPE